MGSLLYATSRNGLAEETATVIKAVDLMAETAARGHYIAILVIFQALRSGRPILGGSFRPYRTAKG